jgi:hypothetical protein
MARIHDHFAITDEQKRYTLATLIFEADRSAEQLGINPYAPGLLQANWHFWRAVAQHMPLAGLPDTYQGYRRWMHE